MNPSLTSELVKLVKAITTLVEAATEALEEGR